jgi:hypothetical protein
VSYLDLNTAAKGNGQLTRPRKRRRGPPRRKDRTGHIYGYLIVRALAWMKGVRSYWRCECLLCGNNTVVYGGHLTTGNVISCGCFGRKQIRQFAARSPESHPSWKGDSIGYKAAHERVQDLKGPARSYLSVDCGTPATEWALDHSSDRSQWKAQTYGREKGMVSSLDVEGGRP